MADHRSLGMGSGGDYIPKREEINYTAPIKGTIIIKSSLSGSIIQKQQIEGVIRCGD